MGVFRWQSLVRIWRNTVMKATVIGNGESRQGFDLTTLDGVTYGCNALYRDFLCDYLVCVDKRMVREALEGGYKNPIYTGNQWNFNESNVCILPPFTWEENEKWEKHYQWNSGVHAVWLALQTPALTELTIIGFDLYSKDEKVNNLYKDTLNYESSDHHAVGHQHWVLQFERMFGLYPNVRFNYYVPVGFRVPEDWQKKSNLYLFTRVPGRKTL